MFRVQIFWNIKLHQKFSYWMEIRECFHRKTREMIFSRVRQYCPTRVPVDIILQHDCTTLKSVDLILPFSYFFKVENIFRNVRESYLPDGLEFLFLVIFCWVTERNKQVKNQMRCFTWLQCFFEGNNELGGPNFATLWRIKGVLLRKAKNTHS